MIRGSALVLIFLAGALMGSPARADDNPYARACQPAPILAERFDGPDSTTRWTTIERPTMPNAGGELQAYRASAIARGPQGLRITARRDGGGYVSGRIASRTLYRFGCFDIVAQMPAGRGLWPALWLRTPYGRPLDGEIDIMEGFGSHPAVFQSTMHRWVGGVHHGFACTRIGDLRSSAFGLASACNWQPRWWPGAFITASHHYGLIWTPRAVTWMIDGTPYYTLRENVPDRAMAIQLDLAVGGIFDGNPDRGTSFPAEMAVRSVTVWPLRP